MYLEARTEFQCLTKSDPLFSFDYFEVIRILWIYACANTILS